MGSEAEPGAACDAASLQATGPKSAAIPGSSFKFLRVIDTGSDNPVLESIGEQAVPRAGMVAEPLTDDPGFRASCLFEFDVPMSAEPDRYLFSVGDVYFPIPLIPRDQLEAAGWVANIGVNPQ